MNYKIKEFRININVFLISINFFIQIKTDCLLELKTFPTHFGESNFELHISIKLKSFSNF